MTHSLDEVLCDGPSGHLWVLRSAEYEDHLAFIVFECDHCGAVDYRDG